MFHLARRQTVEWQDLWRKYGAVGIGTYFGIYFGSIAVFYGIYDYGVLTSLPSGGTAVIEHVRFIGVPAAAWLDRCRVAEIFRNRRVTKRLQCWKPYILSMCTTAFVVLGMGDDQNGVGICNRTPVQLFGVVSPTSPPGRCIAYSVVMPYARHNSDCSSGDGKSQTLVSRTGALGRSMAEDIPHTTPPCLFWDLCSWFSLCCQMQEWMKSAPEWAQGYSDRLFGAMVEDHRARSFVLAWATCKVLEPVRLLGAIAITPRMARALGRTPAKVSDADEDEGSDADDGSGVSRKGGSKR